MLLYIIVVLAILLFFIFAIRKDKEGYGAVKSFRRVPKNNCYTMCKQYYDGCMIRYQYQDGGDCRNRFDNCVGACNYSDFHKM